MDGARESTGPMLLGMPGDMLADENPGDVFSTKVGGQLLCSGNTPLELAPTAICKICGSHLSPILQAGRHT